MRFLRKVFEILETFLSKCLIELPMDFKKNMDLFSREFHKIIFKIYTYLTFYVFCLGLYL